MAAMMEIQIQDDFDLDKIARSGQCFPMAANGRKSLAHRS